VAVLFVEFRINYYLCKKIAIMTAVIKQPLSALQQELLELYAHQVTDTELSDIKDMLARYYANKAMDAMDLFCEEQSYTSETMTEWANGHDRITTSNK
jgi:hypothetical protein